MLSNVPFDIQLLLKLAHSRMDNYVIPGLTSYLIGEQTEQGTLRLFHNTRAHQEVITPHSHRFDFKCLVLKGSVLNRTWTPEADGDLHYVTELEYRGTNGKYTRVPKTVSSWVYSDERYTAGQTYKMRHDEVHSIWFGRDTFVLFFEGPQASDTSIIIEPCVNGDHIKTMKTEPWMFRKHGRRA